MPKSNQKPKPFLGVMILMKLKFYYLKIILTSTTIDIERARRSTFDPK